MEYPLTNTYGSGQGAPTNVPSASMIAGEYPKVVKVWLAPFLTKGVVPCGFTAYESECGRPELRVSGPGREKAARWPGGWMRWATRHQSLTGPSDRLVFPGPNWATVDGRNPFRTALKPWEAIVCWYLQGNHSFRFF